MSRGSGVILRGIFKKVFDGVLNSLSAKWCPFLTGWRGYKAFTDQRPCGSLCGVVRCHDPDKEEAPSGPDKESPPGASRNTGVSLPVPTLSNF